MQNVRLVYRPVCHKFSLVRPIFALLVAASVIAAPTLIAADFLGSQEQSGVERFYGTLQSTQRPTSVNLPPNISIGEILVEEGEMVISGQTIATFNQDLIRADLNRLHDETASMVFERRCLLEPDLFKSFSTSSFDGLDDLSHLLGVSLNLCRSFQHGASPEVSEIHSRRLDLLQARKLLLENEGALITNSELRSEVANRSSNLARALQVQLSINETDLELNTISAMLEAIEQSRQDAMNTRLSELSNAIDEQNSEIEFLEAALQNPRLTSPSSGKAARVRQILSGTRVPNEIEVVSLVADIEQNFELHFSVGIDVTSKLEIEGPILINVIGSGSIIQEFTAEIERIPSVQTHGQMKRFEVHARFEEVPSKQVLDILEAGAAVEVLVEFPPRSLNFTIRDIWKNNCRSLARLHCDEIEKET